MITARKIVKLLNELIKLDCKAMSKLINVRIVCNKKFSVHPTVQCGVSGRKFVVGLLGILNGIAYLEKKRIYAVLNYSEKIIKFGVISEAEAKKIFDRSLTWGEKDSVITIDIQKALKNRKLMEYLPRSKMKPQGSWMEKKERKNNV